MSAHLFILLRKRRRKMRKGKLVTLQVQKIPDNSSSYDFLTIVRTRVKKTRWQKISLPVTLIQSMLDSKNRSLQLRIICKRCGKAVKPVLRRSDGRKFRRRNRKRNKIGKTNKSKGNKKRKVRGKQKKRKIRHLRSRKSRGGQSIRPFLVISTRYIYV